ncbi:UNVERIFIED_CONTAM: hypothetical protein K2H54_074508 [Gekko kuhli]
MLENKKKIQISGLDIVLSIWEYEALTKRPGCNPDVWVNLACTYFFLGMYAQAEQAALKAPKSRLQNRLLFHLAHKFADEKKLMNFHQNLQDITEDQLSLASIHYMRSHYQEAIDIYKRILLDNREYLALNVYVALCYYKLDYYDVSQEVLAVYLQQVPDSTIALNLKACNHFRLYNGKAAEAELKSLMDSASTSFEFAKELIKHNLVVFRGGEGALQVLPSLIDVIPEVRLNLVIYYLRQDDAQEAYNLIKDLEPSTPQEYILKGVVNAVLGQEMGSRDHLKIAQQFFQLVGGSASECDTIPGRQCMASCFFLLRQFDDVLIYLNSVKMSGSEEPIVPVTTEDVVPMTTIPPVDTELTASASVPVPSTGVKGGAIPWRYTTEYVVPRDWTHFNMETRETWMLTLGLGSSSRYDKPAKSLTGLSGTEEDGCVEQWARLEAWQARTTCHLEEALMDIPQLVARVVQHKIQLQCPILVPPAQVPPPASAPDPPREQVPRQLPAVPPTLVLEHHPTELLEATFDGSPKKLEYFVVQVGKFMRN